MLHRTVAAAAAASVRTGRCQCCFSVIAACCGASREPLAAAAVWQLAMPRGSGRTIDCLAVAVPAGSILSSSIAKVTGVTRAVCVVHSVVVLHFSHQQLTACLVAGCKDRIVAFVV
jgi:hypothetical protein